MPDIASGILKFDKNGTGRLVSVERSLRSSPSDCFVPPQIIRQYRLAEGAVMAGPFSVVRGRKELLAVESVCGLKPQEFQKRKLFNDLVAVNPNKRFNLAKCGERSMRIIDLVAPIGKGTRGLIISPPKAGKTVLLGQIAEAILYDDPKAHVIVLLIDERPEEVTSFRRKVKGAEVLASTIDGTMEEHIALAELMLANIRVELECGRDVVILVDSLTRMGRSFNRKGSGTGRVMSGGVEVGALETPRRFFGMARNIENGGSVTIIATILVDTGSRMDQLIYEEFKGTGNSEIVLDRSLAEQRIFPAINIPASGTRKEEILYNEQDMKGLTTMRRVLSSYKPREAIESMDKLLKKYPTNEEFLKSLAG
ncbi:MAG: transcription termination factor Rho [Planctomycetes bacterium GWF2_41_51]|nr:MAG: transcription termination factor Rho [Planctomycetes bacterium GWF2_41_51]HBG26304.1 transcription termination factor Rho [Phycisphaerales bacterium]